MKEDTENDEYNLYHSSLTPFGWSTPDEVFDESATAVTPPSFDIDKNDNVASLTWADFSATEEQWTFYKGSFSLLDTTPYLKPIPYDSTVQMTPESPNYVCDQEGLVDGYLLWEKEGEVYAAVEVNGVVQNIGNLSNTINPSIHPNLSIWGDSLYAVWQETFPFGSKIFFAKRLTGVSNEWDAPYELTFFPDTVEFPVCVGPYIAATGKTQGGNYDISILRNDEFGDRYYIYGITETTTESKFPAICYSQNYPAQGLYVIWTEDTTSTRGEPIGTVKAKNVVETNPVPKIAVNLGSVDCSPYTVQREGYEVFGNLAFESIDYHRRELIYRLTGLNPLERYKLKLVFYYENEDDKRSPSLLLRVKAGTYIIGGVNIEPGEPRYFEKWIPPSAYQSGTVDITIEKWIGDYEFAVCSELFLYEYATNNGKMLAQIKEDHSNLSDGIQFNAAIPNPFKHSTNLTFSISTKKMVSLKIYDATGRLYKILEYKTLNSGTHCYKWDGRSENSKAEVCGIYFSVLTVGDKRIVRKIVKVR